MQEYFSALRVNVTHSVLSEKGRLFYEQEEGDLYRRLTTSYIVACLREEKKTWA